MITLALRRERARSTVISSFTAYENGWEAVYPMVMFMTRYDYATGKFCFTLRMTFIKTELDGVKEGIKKLEWNGWVVCVFIVCFVSRG
jgi:hypothetical protein